MALTEMICSTRLILYTKSITNRIYLHHRGSEFTKKLSYVGSTSERCLLESDKYSTTVICRSPYKEVYDDEIDITIYCLISLKFKIDLKKKIQFVEPNILLLMVLYVEFYCSLRSKGVCFGLLLVFLLFFFFFVCFWLKINVLFLMFIRNILIQLICLKCLFY